jgi:hypothetical protein
MNRWVTVRERVNRSMHLDAGSQPIGQAGMLEPLDPPLDEVAQQVPRRNSESSPARKKWIK